MKIFASTYVSHGWIEIKETFLYKDNGKEIKDPLYDKNKLVLPLADCGS